MQTNNYIFKWPRKSELRCIWIHQCFAAL